MPGRPQERLLGRQERLRVTCWCERTFPLLPAHLIGLTTVSCGNAECHPPSEEDSDDDTQDVHGHVRS